jgi:hypothetical protein
MPEVLHQSDGLKIVRNDKNKFCIVTLHYTADPIKRTPEWKAEASAGMQGAKWDKEYEINYTALYGQRVFPEIQTNREKIVVQPPYPDFPPTQIFWAGFDFGSRNPSSFHVYTVSDGVIYAIWELYEPCKNIPDLAGKILGCPYYSNIKYIACDPVITNQKSRTNKFGDLVTLNDLLIEQGIKKLRQGDTNESTWLAEIRKRWSSPEDPTFQIYASCPAMIQEFENAVYASQNERELLTQTYRENLADINNHALDDNKYFINSRPITTQHAFTDPEMWRRWVRQHEIGSGPRRTERVRGPKW